VRGDLTSLFPRPLFHIRFRDQIALEARKQSLRAQIGLCLGPGREQKDGHRQRLVFPLHVLDQPSGRVYVPLKSQGIGAFKRKSLNGGERPSVAKDDIDSVGFKLTCELAILVDEVLGAVRHSLLNRSQQKIGSNARRCKATASTPTPPYRHFAQENRRDLCQQRFGIL
jgi:hypothetical protein